jgi:hypothetical protein
MIVSATGHVVCRAGRGEEALSGLLPASGLADAAKVFPLMRDRRPDAYGDLTASRRKFARLHRKPRG